MYACMHACTYVCMYVCVYVCMYVCVTKLCVKDGVCESEVSATSVRHLFFASAPNVICPACGITADLEWPE